MTTLPLPLIQEEWLMAKKCTLSTSKLPVGGLPKNSVVRITDCRDMTAAYHGRKSTYQTITKEGLS